MASNQPTKSDDLGQVDLSTFAAAPTLQGPSRPEYLGYGSDATDLIWRNSGTDSTGRVTQQAFIQPTDPRVPIGPIAPVPIQYHPGDEWSGASLDTRTMIIAQNLMVQSGLIDTSAKNWQLGNYGSETAAAMKVVMANANRNGVSWTTMLQRMAQSGNTVRAASNSGGGGSGSSGGGGRTVVLSSPDDLKKIAQQVSQQTIGRYMDDTETKSFIDAYHRAQTDYQRAAGYGGTITSTTDPQVMAENMVKQRYGNETTAHNVAQTFDNFMSIIGG